MAHLFKIAEARGEKHANAVFFHGLGGDAYTTWQADRKHKATFWPGWLAEDIEGLSVYSVGYEAPVSRWRGRIMHLTDRATNVLGDLLDEPSLANGAFVLIGHSLGGLLIKQILRTAQSEAESYERPADFLRRVEKIVFLATPHAGADLAVWGDRLRILVRPSAATICLVRNDPNLRDLNQWYRAWSNHQKIPNLVLTETKSLRILGMIVKPDSSDPGLAGPRPRPMDYDHVWICKPTSRRSDIYTATRGFIEFPIERPIDPVAAELQKLAAEVARQKGVEVAPLLAVLVKLGEKGVREEDIPKRIDAAADKLIELRTENEILRRGPPALASISEEVQALIDKGDFDAAPDALGRGREAARTLRIDASRHEALFVAQGARVDSLQLAYRSAASKYAEAASLVVPFDTERQWGFLLSQAGELYKQGDEFGDNDALIEAIDVNRRCLALTPRSERPLDWAMTQNNLGTELSTLGERENGTERLLEAVDAYREALKERTRERVPLDWAMTQNNRGTALSALGQRENGTERLLEAVDAYREALEEFTRERRPLQWATTQSNLGTALRMLGERENGTARLEAAVDAHRAALEERTRERAPLDWATTQNNLGSALLWLGERESGTARLEAAVGTCRAALEEFTRERAPLQWAMTQNNLGNALLGLGRRESGTARLEAAVDAYRAALQEYTRERVPPQWATTQHNLGIAQALLTERLGGTAMHKSCRLCGKSD